MVKGKYMATVSVNFCFDENRGGLVPFDEMKRQVHEEMTPAIQRLLEEEFGEFGTVRVIKCYDGLYHVEGKP